MLLILKGNQFRRDTGPYLLYSYARAASILRKAGKPLSHKQRLHETDYIQPKIPQLNLFRTENY